MSQNTTIVKVYMAIDESVRVKVGFWRSRRNVSVVRQRTLETINPRMSSRKIQIKTTMVDLTIYLRFCGIKDSVFGYAIRNV